LAREQRKRRKTGLPGASTKNTGDDAWLFVGCSKLAV
jgi:hypothetical protein